MKKLLSSLLAIVFVMGVCFSAPVIASAEGEELISSFVIVGDGFVSDGGKYWTKSGGDITVTPPENYTISISEDGEYSDSVIVNVEYGTPTVVYIKTMEEGSVPQSVNLSDIIVFYADSTSEINSIEYIKLGASETINVALNGNTIKEIVFDGTPLVCDDEYTVSVSDEDVATITLLNTYLDELAAGEYNITISYNPQGETTDVVTVSDTTIALTIEKAVCTAEDFTFTAPTNQTYDGVLKEATVVVSDSKIGEITVKYYKGEEQLANPPVNTGTYTVKIDVAESNYYESLIDLTDAAWEFAITKAPVTITAKDEMIDQYDAALPEFEYTVDGLIEGDNLVVEPTLTTDATNTKTAGIFAITASDADAGDNYTIEYVAGSLTITAHTEHNWVNGKCTACELDCSHSGGTATCVSEAICEICGQPYGGIATENHTEIINGGTENVHTKCKDCGTPVETTHIFDNGTITTPATCKDTGVKTFTCNCGYEKTESVDIDENAHNPGAWEQKTPATCKAAGEEVQKCILCEKEINTREIAIDEDAHEPGEWEEKTPATCKAAGEEVQKCILCEKEINTREIAIDEDAHIPGEWEEKTPATCKAAGEEVQKCTLCEKEINTREIAIDEDAHKPGEWEQKTPATCQAEGVMVKKCTVCNKELETEAIEVLPHTLGGWILDSAPTCVDDGVMHRSCTNDGCNYKEESEITATGVHTPGEWEVKTPATCENDGVKVKKCTVCEIECETDLIKAEHTLGEWKTTKNPTCKEEGLREIKCTVENCQYKETESIEKLPHTEGSWAFVKDSTCSEEGKLEKTCTVCKEVIETAIIPVKAHDFTDWTETKVPTCVAKGEEKRECKDCGASETREVKVLGHDFSEEFTIDLNPTCTETGSKSKHCSRCDEKSEVTVIAALGHDYKNVDFTIDLAPTCTEAGSKSKHCTRCEQKAEITVIEATGHIDFVFETIKEATCTTAGSMLKKCKCGEELETIITSPKEHVLSDWIVDKEATCTVAGSKHKECTSCKAVLESGVIDILGHKYGEWSITKDATCSEDGSKYRICSVCEDKEIVVIEKIAHKNAEIIDQKDATCLEDGYSGDKFCPDCKEIIEKGEVLKATGHTVSDWITDKEPTFTEGGTQHKECTVCKEELQTAIIEKLTLDTPKVKIENDAKGVKVTWTQDEDAAGYTIYSSQYNAKTKTWSKWKNRGTLNADYSSWVDKKVQKDVKYKYTVRAVNDKFKSNYKESNSITFITAPKATVTISTTGLLVKWNKIDGADSYIVYRSEKKGSKWSKWTVLGTTGEAKNSWIDDKTVSGVTYRYTIRAVDNKIKSGYVATDGMIFLEQPTLTISNTATGITGTWKKVNGAKGYTIYRSELVNGKWTKWVNLGTTKETAKSFTDKTVKSGNQYKYTLRAVNGKLKSTYKDSNILMYIAEPTLKIKNEANAISGSWNQVKGAKGYIIYRSELKDGKWTKWVNLGTTKETAKSFTDKTVKSGVAYKYTVRAINGKYKSSFVSTSNLVFLSVPEVKATNNAKGVKISWNKITGAESYIVYRREFKSDKWTKWVNFGATEKNSFIDSTAVSNIKYQYTVRAVNGDSKSVYVASQTLHYIAAPVVTLEETETGINVSWTKVDGAKNYTVYRSVLGEDGKWSSWQNMDTVKGTKSSWIDKSTGEDVVYRYTVRAINGKLKSAYVASEPLMIESEKESETEQPTTELDTNNAN